MDDVWFHTFAATASQPKATSTHKRRGSLLQQPTPAVSPSPMPSWYVYSDRFQAVNKTDVAADTIGEDNENVTSNPWLAGPPKATVARRAQSYSDFYHVVTAHAKKEDGLVRQRSVDLQKKSHVLGEELAFEDDFAALEVQLLDESHARYESYAEQLHQSESHLTTLLDSTSSTLALLASLSASFEAVESQTEAFRKQCESLVSEQRRFTDLADAIEENARYYTYLEPMTRRLNAPGAANLVKGKEFPEMLSDLDNCLAYMEAHPKQLESATYRSKYRLLLTRSLTLIRHHFTRSLGDIATDISKRVQAGQLKETTHSALLYAKFRVPAPELKLLGLEIQKRAVPTPDDVDANREPEYASLMRELYQSYSTTRGRLILPLVNRKMADLGSSAQQSEILAFSKIAIGFMRGICLDEHELWFEWFETDGALYDFLESLMEPMYDYLRPRTIHETKLEKLCEMCATVQGRYMHVDLEEDESETGSGIMSPAGTTNGRYATVRKLDFASLVQPALEDAQTRLVFLALAVLRDEIEYYKPKPTDLEWPKHHHTASNGSTTAPALSGRRTSNVPQTPTTPMPKTPTIVDSDTHEAFARPVDPHSKREWYFTLPRALHLLRSIYRLVNSSVFDDLAHRIVHTTTLSLLSASSQIAAKTPTPPSTVSNSSSAHLFLLTHLLHLKSQIQAFDIEFLPVAEVGFDFTPYTNSYAALRWQNPVSWFRLLSSGVTLPKVVANMLDAKAELDAQLRVVIEAFVAETAGIILAPLRDRGGKGKEVKDGEWEAGEVVKATHLCLGLAARDAPVLHATLLSFFPEVEKERLTRQTLVQAVRERVVQVYTEVFDAEEAKREAAGGEKRRLSRKGKAREGEMLGPEVFGEEVLRAFEAGNAVVEDIDEQ
jgi:hypothetical protein